MSKLFSLWDLVSRFKNVVVGAFIFLIVGILDENSFLNLRKRAERIDHLRAEIENYRQQYEWADRQLRELESNPAAVEKLARENYYMQRDNEDIFIVNAPRRPLAEKPDSAPEL